MNWATLIRRRIKAGRKRGALSVRVLDFARLLPTSEGRARLWTKFVHGAEVHQTTPFTAEDRYPELFELAARLAPRAERILSFGCSTGEELVAIRHRFHEAEIVGVEINPRSRRIAARSIFGDKKCKVVAPGHIGGSFDLIFALAVFQREPCTTEEIGAEDLSTCYPFERFDRAVSELVQRLRHSGLLCVTNNQYRIEDSSIFNELQPVLESPESRSPFFGRDGRRLPAITSRTMFRKRGRAGKQAA